MANRITYVELEDSGIHLNGEPILDTSEGVLIISFDDGTSRVYNWDYVVSYYYLSEEETANARYEDEEE